MELPILAKIAEMAINRQIVNDISNKMAKGPVLKGGDFGEKLQKRQTIAKLSTI